MFRFAILFIGLLAFASAGLVQECKKVEAALPIEVRIPGCDAPPCTVYKGKDVGIHIDFANGFDEQSTGLTAKIKATALGITVPYPLPEHLGNVCKNLANGQQCPLDSGEDATYELLFPVGNAYPEIGVNLEIYIENQNKNILACLSVDIQVKK